MKSLTKSLDILEYLFLQGGRAVLPQELSRELQLPSPTCVRILQDFVSRGYVEQLSRSEGYRPGPMISTLFCRDNVYSRLVEASRSPLHHLSQEIHMQVNLAVMHTSGRIMLYYCGIASPWPRFRFSDHGDTATGRLLTSVLPQRQRCSSSQLLSSSRDAFLDSGNGSIRFKGEQHLEIQGFLIRSPGYPDSAFGYGVPENLNADEIFQKGGETQQEIIRKLTITYQTF